MDWLGQLDWLDWLAEADLVKSLLGKILHRMISTGDGRDEWPCHFDSRTQRRGVWPAD